MGSRVPTCTNCLQGATGEFGSIWHPAGRQQLSSLTATSDNLPLCAVRGILQSKSESEFLYDTLEKVIRVLLRGK